MAKSIFKNFDPELYSISIPRGCDNLYAVFSEALDLCVKWIFDSSGERTHGEFLTNDEYTFLEKKIEALAEVGFAEKSTFTLFDSEYPSPEFRDYSKADWAVHGKNCISRVDDEITFTQIYAFGSLCYLDQAITAAYEQKTFVVLDCMTMAACHLSAASAEYVDTRIREITGNTDLNIEAEFKNRQRKLASVRARIRHSKDPKQKDKSLIYECWVAWQNKPEQYKGKADFARSMIDKAEHLQSTKVIEDWCRIWEGEPKL